MTTKQAKIIIPPPPCFTLDTAQTLSKEDGFPPETLQGLNSMSSINQCIIQIIFFDMFSRLRKNPPALQGADYKF